MSGLGIYRDEIDILYAASNKLTQAFTAAEQLEAISDYARETGASWGILFYSDFDDQETHWMEAAAAWAKQDVPPVPIGARFEISALRFALETLYKRLNAPTLISDVRTDSRIDPATLVLLDQFGHRALVVLPLHANDRWIGLVEFCWSEPRLFDEYDQRIYTALIRQIVSVVYAARLYKQTQRRAGELETAKNEIGLLYAASNKLTRAANVQEILEAISDYPRERGAVAGTLLLAITDSITNQTLYSEAIASWGSEQRPATNIGTRFFEDRPDLVDQWVQGTEPFVLVPDVETFPFIDEALRAGFVNYKTRAVAMLHLRNKERFSGVVLFAWDRPFDFDSRDERILTALAQQASPIMDSLLLFEQTQRRATELELARNDLAILYSASNRLTRATNYTEFLDALSDYARERNAAMGMLFTVNDNYPERAPLDPRLAAVWRTSEQTLQKVDDWFIDDREHDFYQYFVEDFTLMLVDLNAVHELNWINWYQTYVAIGVHAFAILKLKNQARLTGIVVFCWDVDFSFDDRAVRLFRTLALQAAPVLDSILLFEQNRKRAARAEHLLRINTALLQATSEIQIVDAVALYAQKQGADGVTLNYIDISADYLPIQSRTIAVWRDGNARAYDPQSDKLVKLSDFGYAGLWYNHPEEVLLIENLATDTRIMPHSREGMLDAMKSRALATIPLFSGGRCQGVLTVFWFKPHQFTEEEHYVYRGLMQTLPPIVATRRAYLAEEEARQESETLYRMGKAINAAGSYDEIVAALKSVEINFDSIVLAIYHHDDQRNATQLEIVGVVNRKPNPHLKAGTIIPLDAFPIEKLLPDQGAWVIEDFLTDPRSDANTQQNTAWLNVRANIGCKLKISEQVGGNLNFLSSEPRQYTERERRLVVGIGDLVAAAVERIRLQVDEREARQESEILYRVSKTMNSARTYSEIVAAVVPLFPDTYFGVLNVYENFDAESATYFDSVGVYRRDSESPIREGQRFTLEEFPIARKLITPGVWTIEDTETDPLADLTSRENWRRLHVRALIGANLGFQGRVMGGLRLTMTTPRRFTPQEKRLVEGLGDLVLSAVERIRLQSLTQQARQDAELLAQINAELSQAADEQAILTAVAGLAEWQQTSLSMLSYMNTDRTITIVSLRSGDGSTPLPLNFLPITRFSLEDYPILDLAYQEDTPLFIEDVARSDQVTENARRFATQVGWAAIILIPLKIGEQGQGLLSFAWATPQQFSANIRTLFTAIRPTVASVVSRRRAYLAEEAARRESEQRAHELETVAKVSAAAASILDVQELLDTVSYLTSISFEDYHIFTYLLDDTEEFLRLAESPIGEYAVAGQSLPLRDARSLVARAAQTRQGIIVNDINNEPEYSLTPLLNNAYSEMAVPMIAAERLIGVLDVQSSQVERFTEIDIRIMSTLADLIAVAVQNAKLYEQAQELAALEERNRLARELHDSVSQALYGIGLGARTARKLLERDPSRLAEPLDYIVSLAEAGLTEMRALIFELRPESLENEGLVMALKKQAAALFSRHGMQVDTDLPEDEPALPMQIKETVYSITREALHNIVKHAQAKHVRLVVWLTGEQLSVQIRDDGIGFDTRQAFPGHLGLQSMRERAERAQGRFLIESTPGVGTQITLILPVRA